MIAAVTEKLTHQLFWWQIFCSYCFNLLNLDKKLLGDGGRLEFFNVKCRVMVTQTLLLRELARNEIEIFNIFLHRNLPKYNLSYFQPDHVIGFKNSAQNLIPITRDHLLFRCNWVVKNWNNISRKKIAVQVSMKCISSTEVWETVKRL